MHFLTAISDFLYHVSGGFRSDVEFLKGAILKNQATLLKTGLHDDDLILQTLQSLYDRGHTAHRVEAIIEIATQEVLESEEGSTGSCPLASKEK